MNAEPSDSSRLDELYDLLGMGPRCSGSIAYRFACDRVGRMVMERRRVERLDGAFAPGGQAQGTGFGLQSA
jgi:hypothetical protein